MHSITPAKPPVSTSVKPVANREQDLFIYITTERYNSKQFYGVIIDTGTSKISTAGYRQYLAYRNTITDNTDIDTSRIRAINVQFGIGSTASIKSVIVKTLISPVNFYVVNMDTPFLLCLADIDKLQVYYNNVIDTLISPALTLPITRRFRHPFLI
jgi:hypothetical protein